VVFGGEDLAVAAADGVVGDGELAGLAPDQRGGIGELEAAAFVGALEDQKG
jgi:hypothetical protein